ncbi:MULTISPECIES: ABC transporter substrate-binding protein [Microbacterium]|uniref:ABC transporter substrate-binding protein n=1 Tax=Microbacterium TaxID=33882 RepID=UPI002788740C|nr:MULTISPECIES: ABC transporter substrate-binding protein [Microbacterium]MDQ1082778.1 iron complex transport system substrate-binding protein [Microbacterium sp. SORGH_AS_0344]MDQ1168452.1 iron complex transport system substrate-binding protein [Microbacterium proteolyticum]
MTHASARPRTRRRVALAAAIAAALSLAGCATPAGTEPSTSASTAASTATVTIEHAYGGTVIPHKPQRIVTLGWMTSDVVAALGTNPVGMEEVWGTDESGYQPWFEEYVTEQYGELPTLIPPTEDGPNYEAIMALQPDLILSLYSGITDVEYERLSEIAPTVPYLERPWDAGTWQDLTRVVGRAMSEDARAEALIADTEGQIADLAAAHPEFEGKTFVWGLTLDEGGTDLGVYLSYDPRVRITEALGFVSTSAMDEFASTAEGDNWYSGVSLERLSDVQADLFVGWGSGRDQAEYSVQNKVFSRWAPIAAGAYVYYTDATDASAISAPTVLSLPFILPRYVDDLAAALRGEPTIAAQ